MTEISFAEVDALKPTGQLEHAFSQISDKDTYISGEQMGEQGLDSRARYLGRHKILYRDAKGYPLLTLGPQWFMTVIGMSALIALGIGCIYNYWALMSDFKKVAVVLLMLSECSLYTVTALLNPGIVVRDAPELGKSGAAVYCTQCITTREDKVIHCHTCGVCIAGHDHHCIWTGKCIGKGNFTPFIFFLVCTPCYIVTLFMVFGEHS